MKFIWAYLPKGEPILSNIGVCVCVCYVYVFVIRTKAKQAFHALSISNHKRRPTVRTTDTWRDIERTNSNPYMRSEHTRTLNTFITPSHKVGFEWKYISIYAYNKAIKYRNWHWNQKRRKIVWDNAPMALTMREKSSPDAVITRLWWTLKYFGGGSVLSMVSMISMKALTKWDSDHYGRRVLVPRIRYPNKIAVANSRVKLA